MTYDICLQHMQTLAEQYGQSDISRNEAQTRFDIIDGLLIGCFGWEKEEIKVEEPHGNEYTDYVLGNPRLMIVEAKRESIHFDLPAENTELVHSLAQLSKLSKPNALALDQVQTYCARRGVRYAVLSNGHQLIAFVAVRSDGIAPLEGKCLVVNGLEQMLRDFARIHSLLSKLAVEANKLNEYLKVTPASGIPRKISASISGYPAIRNRTDFQANLKIIADLVLEDILAEEGVEQRFYEECYCEGGALSQYALLSKRILSARYAALFDPSLPNPALQALGGKKKNASKELSDEVLAMSASRRPIVLIGDVGVGKTSFIKNLIFVTAKEEFSGSLFIYIDLGRQGTLSENIRNFVLDEIESQLIEKHNVDLNAATFIYGVYHADIARFKKSMYGELEHSDPPLYKTKLRETLESKIQNRAEHLRRSIEHISNARREQIVIAMDNADQRSLAIQQEAFVISEEIAAKWGAVVFITVRPHTFYQSKRAGALSAYPTKAFTIAPPRIDQVLEKRLTFALDLASGTVPIQKLQGVSVGMHSLALFLKSLLDSLKESQQLIQLIDNISNGNVRTSVELVTKYIGSPNADSERIVQEAESGNHYMIPLHDFARTIIYGEYMNYYDEASLALNLFDVTTPDVREHFLSALLISFLRWENSSQNHEGFVTKESLFDELQSKGFSLDQIQTKLRNLTNKKLIETTERMTFEEDVTGLIGDLPAAFRATSTGSYHVLLWAADMAYLEAVAFDTPIFGTKYRGEINEFKSPVLKSRYNRALSFRSYLSEVWEDCNFEAPYFDWYDCISAGQQSFDKVTAFLDKQALNRGDIK